MEGYRRQGQTLYEAGLYQQAIPFLRKALELGEREFGPDHPTTATTLNNLAQLYRLQGRYEELLSKVGDGGFQAARSISFSPSLNLTPSTISARR